MSERRLTKKQHEFLECFKTLADANNFYSPSLRELQAALGLKSVSTAAAHADALVEKGYLQKDGNTARSLRLIEVSAENENSLSQAENHFDWLRKEIESRSANPELAEEVAALEAALQILDQTDKK